MKKQLLFLVLFPIMVIGQTQTQNYIKKTVYRTATTTSLTTPSASQARQSITYFDGIGRSIQKIESKQSASAKNIITHIEYDAFGRQAKEFLPYTTSTSGLDFESTAATDVLNYSQYTGQSPFSEKQFEESPLDRVFAQGSPGTTWALNSGHEVKMDYQSNTASEVKYYTATATWNGTLELFTTVFNDNGNYPANSIHKTIVKNENWISSNVDDNTTHEFNDKEGNVILKRRFENNIAHDTYYVYDQFGNLSFVTSPLMTDPNTEMDKLGYQYKYDRYNRPIAKKLPGKEWEFKVFDKLNRPVANGPVYSPWGDGTEGILITEYDVLGRVVKTGWLNQIITETSRKSWQGNINNGSNPFVLNTNDLLTQNFYDNYSFTDAPSPLPTSLPDSTYPIATNVRGLPTGTWIRILDSNAPNQYESAYTLYDDKYRPVRIYTKNYLGGYTQIDSKLDFVGKPEYTITKHKRIASDTEILIRDIFTYSEQERLLIHKQKINTEPEQLIVSNTYDELGKIISKYVGGIVVTGATGLQKIDYNYNIRGWLKGINDITNLTKGTDPKDLFAFKINYEDNDIFSHTNYIVPQLFNGNMSETYWRTSSDNVLRKYGYNYDDLNRLTNATYQKPEAAVKITNSYNESISYDKNGNITNLARTGEYDDATYQLPIDDLTYSYDPNSPNQLTKVFDATNNSKGFTDDTNGVDDPDDDYTYDEKGNLLTDTNKGIDGIVYNHMNLPTAISFASGKKIIYLYDATGRKVKKMAPEYVGGFVGYLDKEIDYLVGGFQYRDGILSFFPHEEGYVNVLGNDGNNGNGYNYVFNYTDHLGNVRVSYGIDPSDSVLKILEESNYYPFGLKHKNYNVSQKTYIKTGLATSIDNCPTCPAEYKHKYNGKELQEELGLNLYDYGARNYDPALGRWMNIDPLAEFSRRWTPYTYAMNNPIYFIDPDGKMGTGTHSGGDISKDYEDFDRDEMCKPDDVIIKGKGADKTLAQLQKSTSLKLTMDAKGKVTATGEAKTKADKELKAATTNSNATVVLNSTLGHKTTDGSGDNLSSSGSFDGSVINADGTATASQTVNPDYAKAVDDFEGTPEGTGVLHETLEGFQEAKRAYNTQTPSGPAIQGTEGYKNYDVAHNKANMIDPRHVRIGEPDRGLRKDGTLWQGLFKPNGSFLPLYQVPVKK